METQNKNIELVSNKKTRVILPNILTLVGVCIGLTSIKFAFDGKFELSIIAVIVAAIIAVSYTHLTLPTNREV